MSFTHRQPLSRTEITAALAAIAALSLFAALVNAKPSTWEPTKQLIGAADSGTKLAAVGRYQLRLDEARNVLGG
jgi:hypothetical protein